MSESGRRKRAPKANEAPNETGTRRGKSQGEKPKLQRQNSAALRKYGDVYESMSKTDPKKDRKEAKEGAKVDRIDKKLKKMEIKAKREEKREEKPKRKLNPYQIFFKEQRLAGKTPTEIGELWKKHKERS